jgi:ribosomal protein S18 acetylase RimI-like enzyme
MTDGLAQRAVKVNWRGLALGHEVFEADGATFVRNTAVPTIYDANFVFDITASGSDAIERLLARAHDEYSHAPRLTFRVGAFNPPAFEARLLLDGYERKDALVLILAGQLRRHPAPCDIRPIEKDEEWQSYTALTRLDCGEEKMAGENGDDDALARAFTASSRSKCPPMQYALAYQDGRVVGHCSSWEGTTDVGQMEDLFVHRTYRRRAIGTALIHYCVEAVRGRGAGPVAIVVDPKNTAKTIYAALG